MKPFRFVLFFVLMSLSTMAFAQANAHQPVDKPAPSDALKPADKPEPSEAQKAFAKLKTLAGSWVGQLTTFPQAPEVEGKFAQFSLRVTSLGNALVHELSVSGRADHPVTMF